MCVCFLPFPGILGVSPKRKPLLFSRFPLCFSPTKNKARVGGSGSLEKKKEKKARHPPKKYKNFLCAEPLESLENGKTHKETRKIAKPEKQGKRKKQGLEGQSKNMTDKLTTFCVGGEIFYLQLGLYAYS